MNVTAQQRRTVLGLFNISEAARQLSWPVQQMHRRIRTGVLPAPKIRLGRRLYFSAEELQGLSKQGPQANGHR